MNKPTLIIGASVKPERYSYKATVSLIAHNHTVFPVGLREGEIEGHSILTNLPIIENVDTVTLYVGPNNQPMYYDYIIKQIKPKRVIFNPGTENSELIRLLKENGIKAEVACTLVLLSIGNY